MKMYRHLGWLLLFGVCACATPRLTSVEYNQEKGSYEEVTYSAHFQAEEYLIKDKLKVMVYGDIRNRYGKEAVTEPVDQWEKADFTIYFSNTSETNVDFTIKSILLMNHYYSDKYLSEPQEVIIPPKTVERINVEDKSVDRYDKKVKLLIEIIVGNQQLMKEIELNRLTVAEYKARHPGLFKF